MQFVWFIVEHSSLVEVVTREYVVKESHCALDKRSLWLRIRLQSTPVALGLFRKTQTAIEVGLFPQDWTRRSRFGVQEERIRGVDGWVRLERRRGVGGDQEAEVDRFKP